MSAAGRAGYLWDSDVCVDLLNRRRAEPLVRLLRETRDDGIAISAVTYGEVYEGVLFSAMPAIAARRWEQVSRIFQVLDFTPEIAVVWADIRGKLRRSGMRVPDNDLMIAATAILFDLTLVTRNVRHFERLIDIRLTDASDL